VRVTNPKTNELLFEETEEEHAERMKVRTASRM
jgi:hypothetical protein